MSAVVATVDLVRANTQTGRWHIVNLPARDETLCRTPVPADALREVGVDAHVFALLGRPVCVLCRKALR